MEHVIRNKGKKHAINDEEMLMTASNLIMAGAETTAMLLAGTTFLLLQEPQEALCLLTEEVRRSFASSDDITMSSTSHLPYLKAVIEESLRLFPPVPITLPRVTPPEGCTIAGRFVAGGTRVMLNQVAAYRSPLHFKNPNGFHPERWLQHLDEETTIRTKWEATTQYENDNLKILKPFSTGPRNCIGKHLAYGEVRTILAKILWKFDLELDRASEGWMDSLRIWGVWEKKPLYIKFTEAMRNTMPTKDTSVETCRP